MKLMYYWPLILLFLQSWFIQAQEPEKALNCISCHESMLQKPFIHEAVTAGCDICHVPEKENHPQKGIKTFTLTDQLPALCFSCHEEFTKNKKHAPAEAGECLTCHNPHASGNKSLLTSDKQNLCMQCHNLNLEGKKSKHSPVFDWNCQECHDPHQSENNFFLKEKKPDFCFNCHEDLKKATSYSSQHPPFQDDCGNCHQPHAAEQDYLLNDATPSLCNTCHTSFVNENTTSKHSILNDKKNCSNCHDPHASNNPFNLISEEKKLCLDCHSNSIESNGRTYSNIGEMIKPGNNVHGAIEAGGCVACHKPHASEYLALVNAPFPKGNYTVGNPANYELCFTCHDQGIIASGQDAQITNFRDGAKNLHYIHSGQHKSRNCILCHNVHGTSNLHLLQNTVKFGTWEMQINYVENPNGGTCNSGCHEQKSYSRQ